MSTPRDESLDPAVRAAFDPKTRRWGKEIHGGDPAWAVDFFVRFYHRPLGRRVALSEATALECATGFGHNAVAFVLAGGRSIVGYDKSAERVAAATELAARLGLGDRARFEVGDIHALPPAKKTIVLSLQTLEHVPRPIDALKGLAERAASALVLSTPNQLFPRDGHDTGLMFAHWFPKEWRRRYAELRGAPTKQLCRLLTPREIREALPEFRRSSRIYNFDTLDEWLDQFPCFFPYGKGGGRFLSGRSHRLRWRAATIASRIAPEAAFTMAPMIEGIWLRSS